MPNNVRGAGEISNEEFLRAYNDSTKTNAQVVEALRCGSWTPVNVKLRSEQLSKHLTVQRTGGFVRGEHVAIPEADLEDEAKEWLARGTFQPAGWVAAAPAEAAPAEGGRGQDEDAEGEGGGDQAEDAPAVGEITTGAAEPGFSFTGILYGEAFIFSGPNKAAAGQALFTKLTELNFTKVQIADDRTGGVVGFGELANGGRYMFSKQLTAATLCGRPGRLGRFVDVRSLLTYIGDWILEANPVANRA